MRLILTRVPAFILLLALVALTGCGGGVSDNTGGGPPPPPPPIDGADSDGDGLSDVQETTGWVITVDFEAFGPLASTDKLVQVHVTSNPAVADSDDDGISDKDEYFDRTNPSLADTDGDGLSDYAEKFQWKTNPKGVDSDGDARGPAADQFPRSELYDGAEISHGTSPSLKDTDGDGMDDFTESFIETDRSPIIAELPKARVKLAGDLDMRFNVTYTTGSDTKYGSTFSRETSNSTSQSDTTSTATTVAGKGGFFDDLEFSKQGAMTFVGKKVLNLGLKLLPDIIANDLDINKEPTPDVTTTESTTLTTASSETAREEHSRYVTDKRSETAASGTISVPVSIKNVGPNAFNIENLFLTLGMWHASTGTFKALATLQPQFDAGNKAFAVNQTAVFNVDADNVNVDLLKEYFANPSALIVDPAQYDLSDADGKNFVFITEHAYKQTALLIIDYGEGNVEQYRVASSVDRYALDTPNPDDPAKPYKAGDPVGVTMAHALTDMLSVDYATTGRTFTDTDGKTKTVQVLTRVKGVSNLLNSSDLPFPEDRVPGSVQRPSGYWLVYAERDSQAVADLNFGDMLLHNGDQVRLVYVQDLDGDGLTKREEYTFGSVDDALDMRRPVAAGPGDESVTLSYVSYPVKVVNGVVQYEDGVDGIPDSLDSDEDGLTDYEETRVGWTATINGASVQVFSDPLSKDADGDGASDYQEMHAGTNPAGYTADMDGDGLLEIWNLQQLDWMHNNRAGTSLIDKDGVAHNEGCPESGCFGYELVADLDFDTNRDGTFDINDTVNFDLNGNGVINSNDNFFDYDGSGTNRGWLPLGGDTNTPFAAEFAGNNHTIRHLYINRPGRSLVGFIAVTSDSSIVQYKLPIRDLNFVDLAVTGGQATGGLVGYAIGVRYFDNCHITGSVQGTDDVGGILGQGNAIITDSTFNGDVTSTLAASNGHVGGLVGSLHADRGVFDLISNDFDFIISSISNSSVSGNVSAVRSYVGGLIGDTDRRDVFGHYNDIADLYGRYHITISNSHASGNVSSTSGVNIGGLVGHADLNVTIQDSYATGNVSGVNNVGGLVGTTKNSGAFSRPPSYSGLDNILRSFATSSVTATGNFVGGLVGLSYSTNITDTFATGAVNGAIGASRYLGGLVGGANQETTMTNNFATGVVTGLSEKGALVGWSDNAVYTDNYFANDRGLANAIGVNNSAGDVNPSGTLGAAVSELQCPITASDTTCIGATLYNAWDDTVWDFGNSSQLPGLIINSTFYRDGDGDGALD